MLKLLTTNIVLRHRHRGEGKHYIFSRPPGAHLSPARCCDYGPRTSGQVSSGSGTAVARTCDRGPEPEPESVLAPGAEQSLIESQRVIP